VATSSEPDLLTPSEVNIRLVAATYNHFDMDNYTPSLVINQISLDLGCGCILSKYSWLKNIFFIFSKHSFTYL